MKKDLKLEILEKVATLVTAGFGLVAALAWNSAIRALFDKVFGEQSGIIAMFVYAVVVTVVVVLATIKLGRAVNKVKEELGLVGSEKTPEKK
ncbi:hypothetical protein HQ544_05085 [Candidatus Falkowbacteria bacterium]|nr:hypothetical protein [Candidatus Falkowbacteria bacterium]